LTFSAEIELFHNDFAYPDIFVYSNDICFKFLDGDTFTKLGYGVECRINPINKRIFDIKLGKNYELEIGQKI